MADVAELLLESWSHVSTGAVPPTPLLKALVSKVLPAQHPRLNTAASLWQQLSHTAAAFLLQCLGYGILTFSILVKLPQVRRCDGHAAQTLCL
jgi:hypothetical protein